MIHRLMCQPPPEGRFLQWWPLCHSYMCRSNQPFLFHMDNRGDALLYMRKKKKEMVCSFILEI